MTWCTIRNRRTSFFFNCDNT